MTSYNRNFPGRNDGRRKTMNFIASPEIVFAFALGGKLSFNPLTDYIETPDGSKFKLNPPKIAPEVPEKGFEINKTGYIPPSSNPDSIEVVINKNSKRLAKLDPFPIWNGEDFKNLPILV